MPSLTGLTLHTGFTNEHAQALNDVAWEGGLPALTGLDLSYNPELSYASVVDLVAPLPGKTHLMPHLQHLTLRGMKFDEEAWQKLLEEALPNVQVQSK